MADRPQPARPSREIEALVYTSGDVVAPARFPQNLLRWRNDRAAAEIGLDGIDDAGWIARFARFEPIAGSLPEPLALRYHGHQFRIYNPDIGDGRGFLYAQFRDTAGRLMDLGTKGSGRTPHSRSGDGRLTLKGAVRELLATEMLEALGVETSRTLSIVETGEALHRGDEPSPTRSAVLVRLSHGHIRIGTFERLATIGDDAAIESLTRYVLERLLAGEAGPPPAPPASGRGAVRLLEIVVARTATLAASYMAAGFVHGVLNSDNINVTGESFDYGPWRFAPTYDARFVAAYFDHAGLYAFGRQAEAILWDVVQLARSLAGIAPIDPLQAALDGFADAYRTALGRAMTRRLGIRSRGDVADRALAAAVETALAESGVAIDRFFFDWAGGRVPDPLPHPALAPVAETVRGAAPAVDLAHPYWRDAEPCSMLIDEVETIWAAIAERDDWSALEVKIADIRRMGNAMAGRGA